MQIVHWNDDKKHRCPECHAVVRYDGGKISRVNATECYVCGAYFAKFPALARYVAKIKKPYRQPAKFWNNSNASWYYWVPGAKLWMRKEDFK